MHRAIILISLSFSACTYKEGDTIIVSGADASPSDAESAADASMPRPDASSSDAETDSTADECMIVCLHARDGIVPLDECSIGNRAGDNQAIDPRSSDMQTPYFATKSDYTTADSCELASAPDAGAPPDNISIECSGTCAVAADCALEDDFCPGVTNEQQRTAFFDVCYTGCTIGFFDYVAVDETTRCSEALTIITRDADGARQICGN